MLSTMSNELQLINFRRRSSTTDKSWTLSDSKTGQTLDLQQETGNKDFERSQFLIILKDNFLLIPLLLLELSYQSSLILLGMMYKPFSTVGFDKVVKRCGGGTIYKAKRTLLFVLLDYVTDFGTGLVHCFNGRLDEGILTFAIVIISGIIVSTIVGISNIRKKNYRSYASENGSVLNVLLYVPTMMPFYRYFLEIPHFKIATLPLLHNFSSTSGMIRLRYAKKMRWKKLATPEERERLFTEYKDFEIGSCWDTMFETIYEAFPQALLQIVVLLEKDRIVWSSDWIPIVGTVVALYGIANGPLNLISANSSSGSEASVLQIISTMNAKGLMLLSFSFLIVSMRLLIPHHCIVSVVGAILMLVVVIDIPFLLIDGWIGRYTPEEKEKDEMDLGSGKLSEKNSRKTKKLKRLRVLYYLVDLIYFSVGIIALVLWILAAHFTTGITRRNLALPIIYIFMLSFTTYYLYKKPREVFCACMPYFLGPFIVRIVRYCYKKSGNFNKFGNGHAIHDYISC